MHSSRRWPSGLSFLSVPITALIVTLLIALPSLVSAQLNPWKKTVNNPPFPICTSLLLTDGTVICDGGTQFNGGTGQWCKLTPDVNGSYVNGSWTMIPSMPAGYTPLYYADVVLADGRVICIGGEYNGNGAGFTNLGAIYNPVTNAWSNFAGPASWANIGDASGMVLPNGKFMLANPLTSETDIYDPVTGTWAAPGIKNKIDTNDEEGWTLLPNGKVLTVDVWNEIWDNNTGNLLTNNNTAELYDPVADSWSLEGNTIVRLVDNYNDFTGSFEMGPQVLRPDGTVICFGATGHNAVYNSLTRQWSVAPDFPSVGGVPLDCADAPACILANGHVLVVTSPGVFNSGSKFFDWDGTTLTPVATNPNASGNSSFDYRMLVLPTGEVMVTDGSSTVEIYQGGNTPQNAWRPTVVTAPTTVVSGQTYTLTGMQFNGLTQGGMYGDDAGEATNYPLVRVTSLTDGSVTYLRTHNHSTMAVATGGMPVSTQFDISTDLANGSYNLVVVANGIPSTPPNVITVTGGNILINPKFEKGVGVGWTTTPYVITNDTYEPAHGGIWKAWLCGYGYTHTDTLAQVVTIPAKSASARLSFWLHIDTMEPPVYQPPNYVLVAHDKLTVQIVNSNNVATTLATYSNIDAGNGYTQKTFDVSAFIGQTIKILVTGKEDSHYATNFLLDDFSLSAPTAPGGTLGTVGTGSLGTGSLKPGK